MHSKLSVFKAYLLKLKPNNEPTNQPRLTCPTPKKSLQSEKI